MNDESLLYRVISPAVWLQSGHVSSQAFRPRPRDNKLLSVYDGDQIAPEAAWRHYTSDYDNPPVGVLAVTVAECSAQDLTVRADPVTFLEHALIDFRQFGTNQIKRKSVCLRDAAAVRGWLYRVESG